MSSFNCAEDISDISQKRISEICMMLGRVNIGTRGIYLPYGASSHATAVMLELVIRHAGYKVGRISSACGLGSRDIVYINGENASIDDYNLAVAEVKKAVLSSPENKYLAEEVSFAMALLICKMNACDTVIFEGLSGSEYDMAHICAPYDLVIAPTIYSEDDESLTCICNAIRSGVREVISGNQKRSAYDQISRACFTSGVRLTLTSRTSFKTEEVSSIERRFSYGERSGYAVKSPSKLICDSAMLVIESALAIRRDGIKMPWTSIISGLHSASGTGCFDVISVSPLLMADSAENSAEVELLRETLDEIFPKWREKKLSLCIPASSLGMIDLFSDVSDLSLIVIGEGLVQHNENTVTYPSCKDAVRQIISDLRNGSEMICFGSVAFEKELKTELVKLINGGA